MDYQWDGFEVYYLGQYVSAELPWHYIPLWVLITTEITLY